MLHIEHRKIERKAEERWLQLQCLQGIRKKKERKKSEKEEEDFEVTAYGSRTVYAYKKIPIKPVFMRVHRQLRMEKRKKKRKRMWQQEYMEINGQQCLLPLLHRECNQTCKAL